MTEFDLILTRLDRLETLIVEHSPAPSWFDLKQAARYCSLSVATLRRGIKSGRLKASRAGGKMLIKAGAIDKFIEGRP